MPSAACDWVATAEARTTTPRRLCWTLSTCPTTPCQPNCDESLRPRTTCTTPHVSSPRPTLGHSCDRPVPSLTPPSGYEPGTAPAPRCPAAENVGREQKRNKPRPTAPHRTNLTHRVRAQNAPARDQQVGSELWSPVRDLSLIHISEPTRRTPISYAVFCLK